MFFITGYRYLLSALEWSFCLFLTLFPFLFDRDYFFYGTASRSAHLILFVEILALVVAIFLFYRKTKVSVVKSPITFALLCLFAVSFISALHGIDFQTSFWSKATRTTGLFYFIHIGFFYLLLASLFSEEKRFNRIVTAFLISAGLFSVGSFLSKDGLGLLFTNQTWSGFTFGNSSFAAMYLYAAFILSIYFVVRKTGSSKKWWQYGIPLLFLINPYLINTDLFLGKINIFVNPAAIIGEAQASSFATLFSVIALCIFWGFSFIKKASIRKGLIWFVVVSSVVVGVFAVRSLLSTDGYLREIYLRQASSARPIVWELSKKSIREKPVIGWGLDNFDRSFEKNYDNRILEEKNGAEAWFDRAHNIFIDQTVETGYLGLVAYLLVYVIVIACLVYVTATSTQWNNQSLAVLLSVYFGGHLIELQTGFDTTISYISLAVMLASATMLFYKTREERASHGSKSYTLPLWLQRVSACVVLAVFSVLLIVGTIPIVRAQNASGAAHRAGSSEKRLLLYPRMFASPLDTPTFLWRTLYDFQKGVAQKPQLLQDPEKRANFARELSFFTEEYRKYANAHPHDYRVRVSLAGAYLYERLLDVDHLNEAHVVLDDAITMNPDIPQAYWMKSVAYLYQRQFNLAREWAKKAYDLNPEVEQSQKIIDYIEESIQTFPDINFFTFSQI